MDDPALFEPFFRGASWDGWRAVLKATYGLPLSGQELSFFHAITGSRNPFRSRVRELWAVAGRRDGEDAITSLIAAFAAALFNLQTKLRPEARLGPVPCV